MFVPQHATSIRTLPIHWSTQRAEWQSHLWRAEAEGRYKTSGERWSIDDGFFRRALVAADGEPAGVELCYVPVDDEHVMTFLLSQSTILPEIVEEVNSWIDNATRQIGSEPAQFDWFAVIGARDLPWIAHPFALGHLRLHPASRRCWQWEVSDRNPSLGSRTTELWCVVGVHGTSVGHDWTEASRLAAADIGLAAGLLAVVARQPYSVLRSPSIQLVPTPVPSIDDLVDGLNAQLGPDFAIGFEHQGPSLDLPEWVGESWSRLQQKPWLASATLTFLEGCRVAANHPSLAGVAFIAAIESVGIRIFETEMCSCGQHRDTTARFGATVALVNSASDTAALLDDYRTRSKLVHQGVLPGSEPIRGSLRRLDPYTRDTIEQYEGHSLLRLQLTARHLLTQALRDSLPPKSKLTVERS